MDHRNYARKIMTLTNYSDFEAFRSLWNMIAWIGHTRPYIMARKYSIEIYGEECIGETRYFDQRGGTEGDGKRGKGYRS